MKKPLKVRRKSISLADNRRPRSKAKQIDVPEGVTSGTVMAIDPGMKFLGWSILRVEENNPEALLIDYGTVYGKGRGTKVVVSIVETIRNIQSTYSPNVLAVEDYIHRPGMTRGLFVVPALIGVIKYDWYIRKKNEPIMIPAVTWKTRLFGAPHASKPEIREHMKRYITESLVTDIEEEYNSLKLKGVQDCLDAIGIGLCACLMILQNRENSGLLFRGGAA